LSDDFGSLMIAFSRRKVEVRRSRRVENDLRDREIEFWSRVVAEEGKMRTHTRADIQPGRQLMQTYHIMKLTPKSDDEDDLA
jgi:hypothetical protein